MTLNWWTSYRAGAAWAICAVLLAVTTAAQPPNPHLIRFTTDDAFDAAGIAPYAGRQDEVYRHIDANVSEHLAHLQRWVRQQSVSAQSRGITEMANLLAGDLRTLGFTDVALVPTSGHPGVFGFYDAGAPRTLLVCAGLAADASAGRPHDARRQYDSGAGLFCTRLPRWGEGRLQHALAINSARVRLRPRAPQTAAGRLRLPPA